MRLLTLNVLHTGIRRAGALADEILAEEPDVVVLSEVQPGDGTRRLLGLLAEGGLGTASEGTGVSSHFPYTVAIATRERMDAVRAPLAGTRFESAVLEVETGGVTVLGVYFPLGADHDLFWDEAFLPQARRLDNARAVVAGDWNTGSALDIGGGAVPGAVRFDSLVASGWADAWRSEHPGVKEYSWHHAGSGNGFRIDHALLSPLLASSLTSAWYRHETRDAKASDHSALIVNLA